MYAQADLQHFSRDAARKVFFLRIVFLKSSNSKYKTLELQARLIHSVFMNMLIFNHFSREAARIFVCIVFLQSSNASLLTDVEAREEPSLPSASETSVQSVVENPSAEEFSLSGTTDSNNTDSSWRSVGEGISSVETSMLPAPERSSLDSTFDHTQRRTNDEREEC